jgi:hypothetical protein
VEALSLELSRYLPGFAHQQIQKVQPRSRVKNVVIEDLQIGDIPGSKAFERLLRHPLEVVYGTGLAIPLMLLIDSLDEAF